MTKRIKIGKHQARLFILAHQGLIPPYFDGKQGILDYIRRVGCIQYDPLNIVGNNPELVLQARIADFKPSMLQELLYENRQLLDGWDKVMSIYSVDDFPYFRRYREAERQRLKKQSKQVFTIVDEVRNIIEESGPVSSLNLDFEKRVNWPWGPTRLSRAALESMYTWGELVIHHRVHTRKIYDLATRHIAEDILAAPDPNRSKQSYLDWRIHRRVGGFGLVWNRAGDAWLGIAGLKAKDRVESIQRQLKKRDLLEVEIEESKTPYYMRAADMPTLDRVLNGDIQRGRAAIIAPLDNLIWERRMLTELFDFEYRWEVYKPVAERQYGYYVLPVLYGNRFVARFEPGRDKESGALVIKKWWWESNIEPNDEMCNELAKCFLHFSKYLGTDLIELSNELLEHERLQWLPHR